MTGSTRSRVPPVPITGVGCICAAGRDLPACMDTLFAGKRQPAPSATVITQHPTPFPVFEVPAAWTPDDYNSSSDCMKSGGLAIIAAREALVDAGFDPDALRGKRIGVCLGTTVGSAMNNEPFYRDVRDGKHPDIQPVTDYLQANPAAMVAAAFGLTGPWHTVNNACSSGTVAVGEAASWVRAGLCDIAIAGGADKLCRVVCNGFSALMIMDTDPCRPFDVRRKGLNLGEGAGVVVLESEASLARRGKPAHAALLGYGNSMDAYHLSAPEPTGTGLRRAIADALAEAGKTPADIAFINAHGTATPDNDRTEGKLFPQLLPGVPFLSTKGYTGHTLGAAGGVEAAFTVACLEQQRIPGNVGFEQSDPEFDGDPVAEMTTFDGDCALSDSLAFGGNNAAIVIGRAGR